MIPKRKSRGVRRNLHLCNNITKDAEMSRASSQGTRHDLELGEKVAPPSFSNPVERRELSGFPRFRGIAFIICLAVIAVSMSSVMLSPGFSDWGQNRVANYYITRGLTETNSPSILNAIVWDMRGFDTLGEETVLFTAATGVFTVMVFGISERGRKKEKIGR